MARLYVMESSSTAQEAGGNVPVYELDAKAVYQSVSFTGTAGTTSATTYQYVRVKADAACHVAFGETAVSTADSEVGVRLSAEEALDAKVPKGTTISAVTVA